MTDASDLDETAEDIKVLRATAQEYDDSAEACDTPGLARFRAARRLRAAELRAIAERFAQLVALATGGARDTARLDALDGKREDVRQGWDLVGHVWGIHGQCDTVREAIDAARDALTPERPADAD